MNTDHKEVKVPPVTIDLIEELKSELKNEGKNRLEKLALTDKQLMEADFEPIKWLVPNTIPNPGLVALSGRPGHLKTFFAMWIARRLSAGLPLFSHFEEDPNEHMDFSKAPPMKTPCLFIEEEMGQRQMKTRALAMENYENSVIHWFIGHGVNVRDRKWVEEIEDFVIFNKIKLIIFDPFSSVSKMKDENSNAEASEVMNIIRKSFVDSFRECTVIFLHHPAKGDDSGLNLRGAGDILGKCDIHIALEKTNLKERIVQVRYEKNRDVDDAVISNFEMQFRNNPRDGRLEWIYLGQVQDGEMCRAEEMKQKILKLMATKEVWGRNEVADQLDISSNNNIFSRAWRELQKNGQVIKKGKMFSLQPIP